MCTSSLNEILELGIDMVEVLIFGIIFVPYYFDVILVPFSGVTKLSSLLIKQICL